MEVGESSFGGRGGDGGDGGCSGAVEIPASSSPHSSAALIHNNGKTVVVRVKRKRCQQPIEAFWLEINERPQKRAVLDLSSLSISDSSDTGRETNYSATHALKFRSRLLKSKKFLVQHVETVRSSDEIKDILQSVMPEFNGAMAFKKKLEERRQTFRQGKCIQIQGQGAMTREKHEELGKNARFKQIWRSRKRTREQKDDDSMNSLCQLYDIVRVDGLEVPDVQKQEETTSSEYDEMLNYLPLLREFIPSAAEEIEADLMKNALKQDDYEYDLYTVEEDTTMNFDYGSSSYPLVQVEDDDDLCYENPVGSDYETDDSNAEDNPLFDYPDDPSEEEYSNTDPSCHSEDSDNADEKDDSDDDYYGKEMEFSRPTYA
ncbi:RNA-directed DNA methylation 4 isoform X2 [Nymphaea colorata]|nr:RNA-directed DNA methylation 4 isoform X2 [Nymphaea colorata]